jgi:hypothetical protein
MSNIDAHHFGYLNNEFFFPHDMRSQNLHKPVEEEGVEEEEGVVAVAVAVEVKPQIKRQAHMSSLKMTLMYSHKMATTLKVMKVPKLCKNPKKLSIVHQSENRLKCSFEISI